MMTSLLEPVRYAVCGFSFVLRMRVLAVPFNRDDGQRSQGILIVG